MPSKEIRNRYIPSPIYPRMIGYAVSLAMHMYNTINMINTFKGDILKDPDVHRFYQDQFKFMTVWNALMQLFYSALGLSCDVLTLANEGKNSSLLKTLKSIRDPVFSSLLFPYTVLISILFWSILSYERTLILPPSVDKILGGTMNHILHTAIVPVVLWEVVFRPRREPGSHKMNIVLLYGYAASYLFVIISSYISLGTWVYPILNNLNGTIYLYLFVGVSVIMAREFYRLQWYLTALIWGNPERTKKVN